MYHKLYIYKYYNDEYILKRWFHFRELCPMRDVTFMYYIHIYLYFYENRKQVKKTLKYYISIEKNHYAMSDFFGFSTTV